MSKIISIHSFRGGTGKSNTTANLAVSLAQTGLRVCVVDTDIQSPGIHVMFQLNPNDIDFSLNDFLWGKCEIEQTVQEVFTEDSKGKVFLIPSSMRTGDIARVLKFGYDIQLLREGLMNIISSLKIDVLLIDTHPGLNEETLMSIALSDVLLIILRPDSQDYQGTAVTVEVARQIEVPRMYLLMNKVPDIFDKAETIEKAQAAFNCSVIGILPHSDEMMTLASDGIFVRKYPDHPITREIGIVAQKILE
ncbi:MAG: MinD/ParA family protein [Candidatus Electryonea clarkiae]|nr:MinD/ParA family protein [Candidatus Electryonea clarkiae]